MVTNFRVVFNSKSCGRCGGTGAYYFYSGGASKGVCFKCRGAGYIMSSVTVKNLLAFREWQKVERPSVQEQFDALNAGRFGRSFKITDLETV